MTNVHSTTEHHLPTDAQRRPIVFQENGEVFANSRDVAAYFGKEVKHVHEAIRNLIAQEPRLGRSNFRPNYIKDLTGESASHYDMDRDGFTLLAMGFTGAKALRWKLAYIEAFNLMEAEIKSAAALASVNVRDQRQLTTIALQLIEVNGELKQRIEALEPKADALDRIATADGSLCVTDAAKTLQMRPQDLFKYLRQHGWIYRRPGTDHDVAYQSKLLSGVLEHKTTTVHRADGSEKVTTQVRVTPKGLTVLAKLFPPMAEVA